MFSAAAAATLPMLQLRLLGGEDSLLLSLLSLLLSRGKEEGQEGSDVGTGDRGRRNEGTEGGWGLSKQE